MSSQTIFVTKGSTDVSVDVHLIQNGSATTPGDPLTGLLFNSAGLVCYFREGGTGAVTQLTLATQTVGGAHTDGGFVLLSDTLMPGSYRVDLSDTIVSGTNNQGTVVLSGHADLAPHTINIVLTDMDLYDGVRGGMTALPNAAADAAGGLVISDAGGLDIDNTASEVTALDTKITNIQGAGFNTSTDSLEAIRDRGDSAWTGGATTSDSGTAQAGSTTTITLRAGASAIDNIYAGQLIFISAGTGAGESKAVASYVGSTKVATIIGTWPLAPDGTSVYEIFPADIDEITAAPTASVIADAVWDENTTGHNLGSTFGQRLSVDVPGILADTGEMQTDLVDGGRLDTIFDSIQTDTAEIGVAGAGLTALSTQASVDAVDGNVDLVLVDTGTTLPALIGTPAGADVSADIAAIKAETAVIEVDTSTTLDTKLNNLQTTASNVETDTQDIQSRLPAALNNGMMPSDLQRIRDIPLIGDGSGTPFDV